MAGAVIGAIVGFAASGALTSAGIYALGSIAIGTLWMVGASIGSLFDTPDLGSVGTTPNYNFGQLSNTKSQLIAIPMCYGKCRVAGNVFLQKFDTDKREKMDMLVGLSAGPIHQIISVMANEHYLYGDPEGAVYTYWLWTKTGTETVPATENQPSYERNTYEWVEVDKTQYDASDGKKEMRDEDGKAVELDLEDCTCDVHLGTMDQTPDIRSIGDLPYAGLAYVGVSLKAQKGLTGTPTIVSIIEGREVWTPQGVRYTRNPAWVVWDVLTDTRDGIGIPTEYLDQTSFEDVAAYCDELVDGIPRYSIDYIIDSQKKAMDILRDIMACFGGYFLDRGVIELHIDRPVAYATQEIAEDNIIKGSIQTWQAAEDDIPNRLLIEWVDPQNFYELSTAVFQDETDIARRGIADKQISMRGITEASIIERRGAELLDVGKKVKQFCSLGLSLNRASVEAGDVVELTIPWAGFDKKWFRTLSVKDAPDNNISVTFAEYSPDPYVATPIPFDRPTPQDPPVDYEDLYNLILSLPSKMESDGTWKPRLKAQWSLPSEYTPDKIFIYYKTPDDDEWNTHGELSGNTRETVISDVVADTSVNVWIRALTKEGKMTSGVTTSILVHRDLTPPGPVTSLTAEGWFGDINLSWRNPTDSDFSHVEIWEADEDDREKAVMVGKINAESFVRHLGSFAERWYWARAVDFTGNVSAWNETIGTRGYSEQASHQDFVDSVLEGNPSFNEAIADLNTNIVSATEQISETSLQNIMNQSDEIDNRTESVAIAKSEMTTYTDGRIEAEAQARTELAAAVATETGANAAAIVAESEARATQDGAIAQSVETLSTEVEGNTASIQTVNESVDGIEAKHAVKFDINGRVTGWEAIGTGDVTSVVFNVDNFAIGDPDHPNKVPFIIADGQVSIDSAFIQNAAIVSTKIKDLEIGRIKMASGVSAGLSWGSSVNATEKLDWSGSGTDEYVPGTRVYVDTESRGRTIVVGYVRGVHWQGSVSFALYKNGVKVQQMGASSGGAYDPVNTYMCMYCDTTPIDGTTYYDIRATYSGEATYIKERGLTAMTIYR